jgi:hypothetical protein
MIFKDGPILVLGNVVKPESRWRARFGLRSIPQARGTRLDFLVHACPSRSAERFDSAVSSLVAS